MLTGKHLHPKGLQLHSHIQTAASSDTLFLPEPEPAHAKVARLLDQTKMVKKPLH